MELEPKDITCPHCSNTTTVEKKRDWCGKCGRRVFYDPKDRRREQWMKYYMFVVGAGIIGSGIYLVNRFIENF